MVVRSICLPVPTAWVEADVIADERGHFDLLVKRYRDGK